MDNVRVNVTDLIQTVRANRAKHQKNFEEAMTIWQDRIMQRLVEQWYMVSDGGEPDLSFRDLPKPVEYTEDYDVALEMLNWETESTIEIDRSTFQNLVLDKWSWGKTYAANTAAYLVQ